MIRKHILFREDQLVSLELFPGNLSEHVRRAIDKYIEDFTPTSVSPSKSKKEVRKNGR